MEALFSPDMLKVLGAPIIAGLVAMITQRLGVAGRARKLDLMEKRIQVAKTLLTEEEVSPPIREQLRRMLEVTARDLMEDAEEDAADTHDPWKERGVLRRYLFLPRPWGIVSWMATIYYYISLFCLALTPLLLTDSLDENGQVIEGAEALPLSDVLGFAAFFLAGLILCWLAVRSAYRRRMHHEAAMRARGGEGALPA